MTGQMSNILQEVLFCIGLFVIVGLLYGNSLFGGFIWDDRAAVVKNNDVLGTNPVSALFAHDFWGTDIGRNDSHKSFRPLTVATFRLDHYMYGLDAYGFHITNVIVYALSCLCVYAVTSQWLNANGARISAVLFACHPVHVEAVASIVGRADALCGLWYCLAVYAYTLGVRVSLICPTSIMAVLIIGAAYLFAACATLSKEIGFTVLGVFVVVEAVEQLKAVVVQSKHYREICDTTSSGETTRIGYLTSYSLTSSVSMILTALWRCITNMAFLLRTGVLLAAAVMYFRLRTQLHGESMLYKWTIMENHVHHLPYFYERALSYAQYHYLYLWKLVYPAELCFDYGYACVPTVHALSDWNNIKPIAACCVLLSLVLLAVYKLRVNIMVGLVLLVVPLTPALNIFVPVGALFAERLLFIPSIGFCILVGELLTVDAAPLWKYLSATLSRNSAITNVNTTTERITVEPNEATNTPSKQVRFQNGGTPSSSGKKKSSSKQNTKSPAANPTNPSLASIHVASPTARIVPVKSKASVIKATKGGFGIMYAALVPILLWCAARVISRNADWQDEYNLFKSGLAVCPRSLKVLTNFALLSMARGQYDVALESAQKAVEIYPQQVAALINAGVACQKMGRYQESIDYFQRCLRVDPYMAKAAGYMGCSYYHWAASQSQGASANVLRTEALSWFFKAIDAGFQAPLILHLTGSTLIELGRTEESLRYYEAALQQSANFASYYKTSSTVPILLEDDIQPLTTINQLGSAYWALHRGEEAEGAYLRGLAIAPDNVPLLTNLGNIYRERGDTEMARNMMRDGIKYSGSSVPPALLNNLGLLELNVGNFKVALDYFQQALHMLILSTTLSGKAGDSVGVDGSGADAIIKENIRRAEKGLNA